MQAWSSLRSQRGYGVTRPLTSPGNRTRPNPGAKKNKRIFDAAPLTDSLGLCKRLVLLDRGVKKNNELFIIPLFLL